MQANGGQAEEFVDLQELNELNREEELDALRPESPTGMNFPAGARDATTQKQPFLPWSVEEHKRFVAAMRMYNSPYSISDEWIKIANHIGTRTLDEVKNHARLYLQRHVRAGSATSTSRQSMPDGASPYVRENSGQMTPSLESISSPTFPNQHSICPSPAKQPTAPPHHTPTMSLINGTTLINIANVSTPVEWTHDEQALLEEILKRFPADKCSLVGRIVKIASYLPNKTVRDVMLRYKWLTDMQSGADEDDADAKRSLKVRSDDMLQRNRIRLKPPTAEEAKVKATLDENVLLINRIRTNLMSQQESKVRENLQLMEKFRGNIKDVMHRMDGLPGNGSGPMPSLPLEIHSGLLPTELNGADSLMASMPVSSVGFSP